jgi:hypothetical protein
MHFLQFVMEVAIVLATSTLVHLGGDGVGNVGQLLLLLLKVLGGGVGAVLLEPLSSLLNSFKDLFNTS